MARPPWCGDDLAADAGHRARGLRLLAEHEPLTALACWFDRVAGYARVKRGVFAAVEAGVSRALAAHSLGPIGEALTLLLDAGKADGTIRPDVDARDVILLIGYLTRLEQPNGTPEPATCSRSSSTDCAAQLRGTRAAISSSTPPVLPGQACDVSERPGTMPGWGCPRGP